jgi:hypothetical protein
MFFNLVHICVNVSVYSLYVLCPLYPAIICPMLLVLLGYTYYGHNSSMPIFWLDPPTSPTRLVHTNAPVHCVTDRVVYACHPHGIIPSTTSAYFSRKSIPYVVAKNMLCSSLAPFSAKWTGAIDNDRTTIVGNVNRFGGVAVFPGGADEMCLSDNRCSVPVNIHIRDGIIRLALENGYTIVPTWSPCELVAHVPLFRRLNTVKSWIWRTFRVAIAPNLGRYCIPGMPRRLPPNHTTFPIQFGRRIECCPTLDTVEGIRTKYLFELRRLASLTGHTLRTNLDT